MPSSWTYWCAVCEQDVCDGGCHDETEQQVADTYRFTTGDADTDVGCCDECWCEIDAPDAT